MNNEKIMARPQNLAFELDHEIAEDRTAPPLSMSWLVKSESRYRSKYEDPKASCQAVVLFTQSLPDNLVISANLTDWEFPYK